MNDEPMRITTRWSVSEEDYALSWCPLVVMALPRCPPHGMPGRLPLSRSRRSINQQGLAKTAPKPVDRNTCGPNEGTRRPKKG